MDQVNENTSNVFPTPSNLHSRIEIKTEPVDVIEADLEDFQPQPVEFIDVKLEDFTSEEDQINSKEVNAIEIKSEELHHSIDIKEEVSTLEAEVKQYIGQICPKFKCGVCKLQFTNQVQLRSHGKIHSAKLFECEICDYIATQKSNLIDHIRIHTGEKPFACEICDYRCSQKGTLKVHLMIHTGEKRFSCEICEYKCSTKRRLELHLRTHTGEKLFSCEICAYKFSRKHHLTRHLKTHIKRSPPIKEKSRSPGARIKKRKN